MKFDPSLASSIDQSTVEEKLAYPIIQWINGQPSLRRAGGVEYTGGFFVAEESIDLAGAAGWEALTVTHRNGDTSAGFATRALRVSVIRMRRRWEVFDGDRRIFFPWNAYDSARAVGRPSGRLHILSLIAGLEAAGPIVLTMRGSVAAAMTKRDGILQQFDATVVRAANQASAEHARKQGKPPARWARRAFWLPLSPMADAKNEPVFTEVGAGSATSKVTLPVSPGLPATWQECDPGAYFVGAEILRTVNEIYADTEQWELDWSQFGEATPVNNDPDGEVNFYAGADEPFF